MKRADDSSKIWAVVLAAGESKRMKSPKLMLPFMGSTIIENVIWNILDSEIRNIIVVTGAWKDEILGKIKDLPVLNCFNEDYKNGMLSSVIAGLNSLPSDACAAMIFQGDQPEIEAIVVRKMINEWRSSEKDIVIPLHKGKRGHPLLIAKKYFTEVSQLDPDIGLRGLIDKFDKDILEVEVDSEMILRDIDTKDDYQELINKIK